MDNKKAKTSEVGREISDQKCEYCYKAIKDLLLTEDTRRLGKSCTTTPYTFSAAGDRGIWLSLRI